MFIMLTTDPDNGAILVNLAQVSAILPLASGGCRIIRGASEFVDVTEAFDALVERIKRYNAVKGMDLT